MPTFAIFQLYRGMKEEIKYQMILGWNTRDRMDLISFRFLNIIFPSIFVIIDLN
jgi:hypothetical protein